MLLSSSLSSAELPSISGSVKKGNVLVNSRKSKKNRSFKDYCSEVFTSAVNYIVPNYCYRAKYIIFNRQKIKVNNFIVVVTLLNLSYAFCFSSFQCLSCISCYMKNFFYILDCSHLFGDSFFIFKENSLPHLKEPLQTNENYVRSGLKNIFCLFISF